jgi:hypothetical protein
MAFVTAAAALAGGRPKVSRYRTSPKVFCDLPEHDYVHGGPTGPVLAVSQIGVLVRVEGVPLSETLRSGRQMAYYQLKTNELRVEHCSISRVSLAIRDDGYWTLSFRADQNLHAFDDTPLVAVGIPRPTPNTSVPQPRPILPGASPSTKFTEHIKRNLFIVKARGYTAFLTDETADGSPGRPVLFEILPVPFWVQRGVPAFPRYEGSKAEIAEFFKTIDRVEVELSYR